MTRLGSNLPEFQRVQLDFAAHIRHPVINPRPVDVPVDRMQIYVELFYNNIERFIATTFPVAKQVLGGERWHRLVRDFVHRHRSESPYFLEISQEFLEFIGTQDVHDLPPFFIELCHYEWVELFLDVADAEIDSPTVDSHGDVTGGIPVWSPVAMCLTYKFPVHQIGLKFQPAEPSAEPCNVIVYRNRRDQVRFMAVNASTVLLSMFVQEERGESGRQIAARAASALRHPNPEVVVDGGIQTLLKLREADIIAGTRVS